MPVTIPPQKPKKQKTDEKKLCSFMGKLMFILAGCWLVIASSEIFKAMWLLWVGLCLFFVVCIGAVIYMNSETDSNDKFQFSRSTAAFQQAAVFAFGRFSFAHLP